ncbi:MTH938/NDUFAF3 family protein [Desulfomarina sp.]
MVKSLRIISSRWGRLEVERLGVGRDFKLWPGGGRSWDWNEFGTAHGKGIHPGELEELIANGSRVIVLTTGRLHRLKISPATVEKARRENIRLIVAATGKGVKLYNEQVEKGVAVGGLFHSTC